MAKLKAKSASRKAEDKSQYDRNRIKKMREETGLSHQAWVRKNKEKDLDRITAGYDRSQYLVAHEITPSNLLDSYSIQYREAWVMKRDGPRLEKIPTSIGIFKPIVVSIVWSATRTARKASLYGGDTGQLGTVTYEQLPGMGENERTIFDDDLPIPRKRLLRLWTPSAKDKIPGISPATFKEWSHDGYIQDRRIKVNGRATIKTHSGRMVRAKTLATKSTWVHKSLDRQSDFDFWLMDEVSIDTEVHYNGPFARYDIGRTIKTMPANRRDIITHDDIREPKPKDMAKVLDGRQTVMSWDAWNNTGYPERNIRPRGSWVQVRPMSKQRHVAAKVEREATKVAQIIIPASVVRAYIKSTAHANKAELIERAINLLDVEGLPVMADTVMALTRTKVLGGVEISYVQKSLKALGFKKLASTMGRGVYGKERLASTVLLWASAYDEELAEELPVVCYMTDADKLAAFSF